MENQSAINYIIFIILCAQSLLIFLMFVQLRITTAKMKMRQIKLEGLIRSKGLIK